MRIRSFDVDNKPAIDSLITANAARLRSTPYLILDVTSNGGGGDSSFESLLPYLYTQPVRLAGAEVAATPGNRAYYAGYVGDERLGEDVQTFLLTIIGRIDQAEPGAFISLDEAGDTEVVLDSVLPSPRAIAVLMDAGTASSAEEFVLVARASAKVITIGAATYGALDYSNFREAELPSGTRAVRLPTTRRTWLPEGSVDATGLFPDVSIPNGVQEWATFALGVLMAQERTGATYP